jgi:hypothetical protein
MNKYTQHTPGPWFYEGQNIRNGDGLDVATVDSERSTERCTSDRIPLKEWTANTHLIAAAPDLLAALRLCEDWIPNVPRRKGAPYEETRGRVFESIIAAIAKAEGSAE